MNNENINSYVESTDINAQALDEIVNELVSRCCQELDDYVGYIKSILDDQTKPISDNELDDFILTLPTLLYFVSGAQEAMGIREDVARMTENDLFNRVLMEAAGTVAAKQAAARLATQDYAITTIIYQRTFKQIKSRVEAAYEVLQSAKKVLSRRVVELEISKTSTNRNIS